MNKQEIFDKVATHLLTQMEKSGHIVTSSCLYRSPNGLKCAIGCLIPDELYDPEFEGKTVIDLPIDLLKTIGINDDHVYLLRVLQTVHDCNQPSDWKEELRLIAKINGLEFKY